MGTAGALRRPDFRRGRALAGAILNSFTRLLTPSIGTYGWEPRGPRPSDGGLRGCPPEVISLLPPLPVGRGGPGGEGDWARARTPQRVQVTAHASTHPCPPAMRGITSRRAPFLGKSRAESFGRWDCLPVQGAERLSLASFSLWDRVSAAVRGPGALPPSAPHGEQKPMEVSKRLSRTVCLDAPPPQCACPKALQGGCSRQFLEVLTDISCPPAG